VRNGVVFALKFKPPRQQPQLVVVERFEKELKERVVCDPVALDPKGGTAIDFFEPSLDGKKVLGVALGARLGARRRPRVRRSDGYRVRRRGAGPQLGNGRGSASWNAEGSGFFYTRHPLEGERPAEDLGFLPAGLLPQAGHAREERHLRAGEGLRAHRRELPGQQRGRKVASSI